MTDEYLAASLEHGVLHREIQVGDIYITQGIAHRVTGVDADGTVEAVEATPEQVARRREAIQRRRELNR